MVTQELAKLNRGQLKTLQAVLSLLHILGLSDEQINALPQILTNWPTMAKNMNAMSADLIEIKKKICTLEDRKNGDEKDPDPKGMDTAENIKTSGGLGKDVERINYEKGGTKV
jgi:hypothetical protein